MDDTVTLWAVGCGVTPPSIERTRPGHHQRWTGWTVDLTPSPMACCGWRWTPPSPWGDGWGLLGLAGGQGGL